MSFILDALKKSESDRQRKRSPDISDVPAALSGSQTPRWLWVLIVLLAINLGAVLYVLLRPLPGPSESSQTAAAPSAEPAPATLFEPALQGAPAQSADRPTPSGIDGQELQQPALETAPRAVVETAPSAPVDAARPPPAAPRPAPAETETYLTYNDLRASGNLGLPDLHIDLHVYSDRPSERFVFINMNQYRENTTLSEGPRLRQITTEGVILEYVGTTFLLPRE